jgi:hypothetical protein
MKTAQEIQNGLAQFYGTEHYHRLSPLHGKLVCTDGVAWLAENAGAFWLIDIIASYQARCMKDEMLRDMQFWTLTVHRPPLEKRGNRIMATVICERDTGDVAIKQEIPYTDFPLPEIKFYVEPGEVGGKMVYVCLLPSEH